MNKTRIGILGTGSHTPERILTNEDLCRMVDTTDEWIVTRTGIHERRIAAENEATSDFAVPAALKACEAAGVDPVDLDAIIVGTATPDMPFPSTACLVQARIGAVNAVAFDVVAACSGFLYGMNIGKMMIESGRAKRVLAIGAETLTKITDWQDRKTCVLFGDAAGAAVLGEVEGEKGILACNMGSDGRLWKLLHQPSGGSRDPATHETVDRRDHSIRMEGQEVFKHAVKHMSRAILKALDDSGCCSDDLTWLFPHQANLRIMEAVAKRIRLPKERVFINLHKYGNTSAASIGLAFDEAIRGGVCGPGSLAGLVAFGGGFTWAGAVVRL